VASQAICPQISAKQSNSYAKIERAEYFKHRRYSGQAQPLPTIDFLPVEVWEMPESVTQLRKNYSFVNKLFGD